MMTNSMCSSPGGPQLIMLVEPENKIRFRYASEGGSHGALKGIEKKTFPTVKLVGYNGKKLVYVKVSLYTDDKKEHVFEFKGKSDEKLPFIKEYLQDNDTAVFSNLKILSKKRDEIFQHLMEQKLKKLKITKTERLLIEKNSEKEYKERAKQILNSLRLCFEAFEEGKKDIRLCDPLFSNVICNQKAASKGDLRIARMSKYAGSWRGGDEVILLCNKVDKDTIKVEFFETNDSDEVVWKEGAVFSKADVHYQVAITFRTPPYRSCVDTEKEVFVCLVRDEERSEPRVFKYTPNFEGSPSRKRKRYGDDESQDISMLCVESSHGSSSNSNDMPGMSEILENGQEKCNLSLEIMNYDLLKRSMTTFDDMTQDYLESSSKSMQLENRQEPSDLGTINFEEFSDLFYMDQDLDLDMTELDKISSDEYSLPAHDLIYAPEIMRFDDMRRNDNLSNHRVQTDGQMGVIELQMDSLHIKERDCGYKSPKSSLSNPCEKAKKIRDKIGSYLMRRDAAGNTLLHLAVSENKDVSVILKGCQRTNKDVINMQNFQRESALLLATKLNNLEAVKILLQCNSNPNLKDDNGNNCYHIAALHNYFDAMYYLLTLVGCEPQINDFNYQGLTPMHLAIVKNSVECFHLLKIHGVDLNVVEQKSGRSLLHYAVQFQPSFVPVLLSAEKPLIDIQDFEGNTPLHIACANDKIEVVKQLLDKGADPLLRNFKERPDSEENSDDFGLTPGDLTTNLEILEELKKSPKNVSGSSEIIEKLCSLLDVDDKWKTLAVYFVEQELIDSLQCSSSPSKALLAYIEKENKGNFIECLTNALEIAGLNDALNIVKEKYL